MSESVWKNVTRAIAALSLVLLGLPLSAFPASAAAALTITPTTSNVVGLDGNDVSTGPNRFRSGARVCNAGDDTATNVTASFVWDSPNALIDLSPGEPSTISFGDLTPWACVHANFGVSVSRQQAALGTSRAFHISAAADGLGEVTTPMPRELYVEAFVSHDGNSVSSITSDAPMMPSGRYSISLGGTYTFWVTTASAVDGSEQLSSLLDLPGAMFRVLSVSQQYPVNTSTVMNPNDQAYADACGWVSDPTQGNYRSCTGPGLAGGDPVVTTYVVAVVGTGSATLDATVVDRANGAFRYNADFGAANARIRVEAVDPATSSDVAVTMAGPVSVVAGADVTYDLQVANYGPAEAVDTQVALVMPSATTFESATAGATVSGDTVTLDVGTLTAGAYADVQVTLHVPPSQTAHLETTATVTTTSPDANPWNDSAWAYTIVIPDPDLAITVTDAPDPVATGGTLTYTVTVTNTDPGNAAADVVVTDTLPAGVAFVSASQAACVEAGGIVTCAVGALAATASWSTTITVTAPGTAGTITNTATVTTSSPDINLANNTASVNTSVQVAADLGIVKQGPANPVPGQDATYTLTVTNNGPGDATGVVVTDALPSGTTFVSATAGGTVASGTVTWNVGNLAANATASLQLVVHIAPGQTGSLANTATVVADQPDGTAGNNSSTATGTLTPSADLSVTKTANVQSAAVGDTVTYTIDVKNDGPSDAASVVVTDTPPSGLTFVSATQGGTLQAGTVVWTIPTIPAGATATVSATFTVDVADGDTIQNAVSVAATTPDPDLTDLQATATIAVTDTSADLEITKTTDADTPSVGNVIAYVIVVANNGPADATGVVVADDLPKGLEFVSANATTGTYDDGTGLWTIGDLANGAQESLTIRARITAPGSIQNTASVEALDQTDPTPANDTGSADVTVLGESGEDGAGGGGGEDEGAPTGEVAVAPTTATTGFTAGSSVAASLVLFLTGSLLLVVTRRRRDEA